MFNNQCSIKGLNMEFNRKNKDIIGKFFFALSVIILIYMLVTPLNHLILHVDEYFTLTLINFNVNEMVRLTAADVHPPLYYLILKFAMSVFGFFGISSHNLYAVRIVSIIPYAIIMIISYFKIRKDYGWLTAGLFMLSLGVMSQFFFYFLIARMYSWAILFMLVAFIYTKEIYTKGDLKYWMIVTIASVLSAYTHYFAGISAVCLSLILIYYVIFKNRSQIKNLCISIVAGVILYSYWLSTLFAQLGTIHHGFWVPRITVKSLIEDFGYYAYSNDLFFAVIAIIILIAIIYLYKKQLNEKYSVDNFYLLTGLGVYLGTIIFALIVSLVYKPVLLARYLIPAAAVLWLSISILINKIEDKKTMMYSFALVCLLLIVGTGYMINSNFTMYNEGMAKENLFNEIMQDENASLILARPNGIIYFLDYSDRVDTYCIRYTYVFDKTMNKLHQTFNFKDTSEKNISGLVINNTDRHFYLVNIMTWGDLNLSSQINKTTLLSDQGIEISRLTAKDLKSMKQ